MWWTTVRLLVDTLRLVSLGFQSRSQLAAENLFLRKQLALYAERRVKARCADDATRIVLVVLARLIDWRAALTIVQPDTLIPWHRKGFLCSAETPSGSDLVTVESCESRTILRPWPSRC
jgi:hypothetical protein